MEYSDNEFIKLNRKTLSWKWFDDVNTAHFFIYCLLSANWKDGYFKGEEVKRGQFVRTLKNMSEESGLTVQNIRTAIKHLKSTQEITTKLTRKGQGGTLVITVVKYNEYQSTNNQSNTQTNIQSTSNQHPINIQSTQIEEDIRSKEEQELKKKDYMSNNSNELLDCPSEEQPDEENHGAYDDLLKLWNSLESFGIQPIRAITKQRLTLLKPRLKEYGRESFAECIEQIKQSDFLKGKHNGKPWTITFDWMIRPTNYPKVLEGNYRNKKGNAAGNNQSSYLQDILGMMKGDSE